MELALALDDGEDRSSGKESWSWKWQEGRQINLIRRIGEGQREGVAAEGRSWIRRGPGEGVVAEESRGGLLERAWRRMRYIRTRRPDGGRRRRGASYLFNLFCYLCEARLEGGGGGARALVYLDRAWPPRLTWGALKPNGLPLGSS